MDTFLLSLNIFLAIITFTTGNQLLLQARNAHRPQELSDEEVGYLADLSNVEMLQEVLDQFLIPRVVNTSNHEKVFKYIVDQLTTLGWEVDVDEFKQRTPKFGRLTFKNVIATLNPSADRFLVLACHYDSKYFKNIEFIGATDSAVPCAMMINLAQVMVNELNKIKTKSDVSLKLIFFDGEEAFVSWGPDDSIYGARHLAAKWERSINNVEDEATNELTRIDVLVLLDLIGAANPKFQCYFEDTQRWYGRLVQAEARLANLDSLVEYSSRNSYFKRLLSYSYIEDDHIPFLQRGVPIVHLITSPFPKVWHTEFDNRDIIDINTVENINKILRVFVGEYLHVSVNNK